jgi:hypothetical protein
MNSPKGDLVLLNEFIESNPFNQDTLFICHASYEKDRAVCALDETLRSKAKQCLSSAIVIATKESLENIRGYRDCFEGLKTRLGPIVQSSLEPIIFSRPELVGMTRAIHTAAGPLLRTSLRSVVVDASVFPKDRLWMVLDYVKRVNPDLAIFVVYTEPAHYATDVDPDGWLSKGVKRLIRVPGFNGHQNPSKKALLALIVGHEQERMQITIRNIEPHRIVLVGQGWQQHGNVTPHLPQRIVRQLGTDYANLVDTSGSVEVGSRDYRATQEAVHRIHSRYDTAYNIIVAGNGSKLQSLGAMMACQENRAIAAVYAEPQVYNESRSSGTDHTWVLKL